MEFIDAVILGLVQGVTEFLPLSSSGHLILIRDWLALDGTTALAYESTLRFAAALAVLTYFWADIWTVIQVLLRKLSRLPVNEKDLVLFYALALGTIPAVLFGIFLEPILSQYIHTTAIISLMLVCSSVFLMYAEWRYYTKPIQNTLTSSIGGKVGMFQLFALIPGFSRSGATIAGGMLLGMSRLESARFSFLLAIPITVVVGSKKCIDLIEAQGTVAWVPVGVGAFVAFVATLVTIHFFMNYMIRHTLWPFIWYSVILAGFLAYVSFIV